MGAIKDPLFGCTWVTRRELFGADDPNPDKRELVYSKFNEFIRTLSSNLYEPIGLTDDVERTLSLRRLHDKIYGLRNHDDVAPKTHPATDAFDPMAMKSAYVLNGKGSMRSQMFQDFIMREINKHTGMSIQDWLNLTIADQKLILEIIEDKRNLEQKETDRLTNQLKD